MLLNNDVVVTDAWLDQLSEGMATLAGASGWGADDSEGMATLAGAWGWGVDPASTVARGQRRANLILTMIAKNEEEILPRCLYFARGRVSHRRVGFAHRRGPLPRGDGGQSPPTPVNMPVSGSTTLGRDAQAHMFKQGLLGYLKGGRHSVLVTPSPYLEVPERHHRCSQSRNRIWVMHCPHSIGRTGQAENHRPQKTTAERLTSRQRIGNSSSSRGWQSPPYKNVSSSPAQSIAPVEGRFDEIIVVDTGSTSHQPCHGYNADSGFFKCHSVTLLQHVGYATDPSTPFGLIIQASRCNSIIYKQIRQRGKLYRLFERHVTACHNYIYSKWIRLCVKL